MKAAQRAFFVLHSVLFCYQWCALLRSFDRRDQ